MKIEDMDLDLGYDFTVKFLKDGHTIEISVIPRQYKLEFNICIDGHCIMTKDEAHRYIECIRRWDTEKFKYIIELSKSGLDADKHSHFDFERLRRAIKTSDRMRKLYERAVKMFDDGKPIVTNKFVIMPMYINSSGFSCGFLVKRIDISEPKYYYFENVSLYRLVKMIDTGKYKLDDKVKVIDAEMFAKEVIAKIRKGGISIDGYEKYLPEVYML